MRDRVSAVRATCYACKNWSYWRFNFRTVRAFPAEFCVDNMLCFPLYRYAAQYRTLGLYDTAACTANSYMYGNHGSRNRRCDHAFNDTGFPFTLNIHKAMNHTHYTHLCFWSRKQTLRSWSWTRVITGPPTHSVGAVLFCFLASVIVCRL